jgi:hypothetical protein
LIPTEELHAAASKATGRTDSGPMTTPTGLPFGGAAADAMRAYLTRGAANRVNWSSSAHRYALADFGLTAADVGARFGALGHRAAELR